MTRTTQALIAVAAGAGLALLGAGEARAQGLAFGGQLHWSDDYDFGLGPRVELPIELPSGALTFNGSFDIYFPDDIGGTERDYWELNGNVVYTFELPESSVEPYAGGGLSLAHIDFEPGGEDTEVGLNVLGGLRFPKAAFVPFVEAKFMIQGGEHFALTGGLMFPIGA